MTTSTPTWHRVAGYRFTFIGKTAKVVELLSGGYLVQPCKDRMPIGNGKTDTYFAKEAEALAYAEALAVIA